MRALYKAALLAGAAWGAAADLAFAAPATAPTVVDDVVVTARRREENLKDVPLAVTAYSADKLDLSGARTITDLAKTTPNLTLQVSRATNSTLTAFIRGVGQQDPLWGFEPGVGLYVDDVYVARPQAAVLDIFDIQRVEVLRGPQGTLYGRNTIGGAVKYVSAPIGNHPELNLRGTFGSFGEHDEIVSGKTPLGSMLSAGFAVAKYDHKGWGHNSTLNVDQDNKDVLAYRGSLDFHPNDKLSVKLSVDKVVDDSNVNSGHREVAYTDPVTHVTWGVLPGKYDTQAGAGSKNKVTNQGGSLTAAYIIDDSLTLKSITAFRDGRTDGIIDFDNTPVAYLDVPARYRDHQFTQEEQLLFGSGRIHGVAGLFYLQGYAAGAFDTVVSNANLTIFTQGSVTTKSLSGFTDVSFDVTDQLQISLGGRYTEDKKTGTVYRQNYTGLKSPFFGNAAAVPGLIRSNYTNSATFTKFTPRASVSYKISPDVTAYLNWGNGFKSGGFDMRGDVVLYPATVNGYRPETVTSTELGLKGSVFDHRLTFATDIFNMDYKDQQITTQFAIGAGPSVASVVDNVGSSRVRGWEGEAQLRATDNLTFTATAGTIDAKYIKWIAFIPAGTPGATCTGNCDVSGQRNFQNTPKLVWSLSATYSIDLGDHGRIRISPTAAFRDKYQAFETPEPEIDQQKGYTLYDVDVVWNDPSNKYTVGLHGKNLSDERYHVGGYYFPGNTFGNSITGFYGPPRTYLLTLSAKFD